LLADALTVQGVALARLGEHERSLNALRRAVQIGDRLDGMRAGGNSAIKRYREILAKQGEGELEHALSSDHPVPHEGRLKSSEWAEGFNMGVNFVKGRVKRAKEKGGKDEIRRELDKPFDSAEGGKTIEAPAPARAGHAADDARRLLNHPFRLRATYYQNARHSRLSSFSGLRGESMLRDNL
jgi:hypothetical protein